MQISTPNQLIPLLKNTSFAIQEVAKKITQNKRITTEEALLLYHQAPIGLLGILAHHCRTFKNQKNTFYIKNIHIEPTNECVFDCLFCSYKSKSKHDAWEISTAEIISTLSKYNLNEISEVHIVGGAHPKHDVYYYCSMLAEIKKHFPAIHIKAFSAIELIHIFNISHLSYKEGLLLLKDAGLNSIPGGGAEIFDKTIREQICPGKANAEEWLKLHHEAHRQNIPTNATMLYGHIENIEHRLDHLTQLRNLQDQTHGFKAFIPLKYKNKNNKLDHIQETSIIDDLKTFAISRIYLDNFAHIKAYWPMLGKQTTQLLLSFGVDDIDGTINDSTQIYTRAGSEEQQPTMSAEEMTSIIQKSGLTAIERNYNTSGKLY